MRYRHACYTTLIMLCMVAVQFENLSAQPRRTASNSMTQSARRTPLIAYTVSMPRPATHLLEVEMTLRAESNRNLSNETRLVMPVWTPGSYLIREYARHVQDFAPTNAESNQSLTWRKINKNTWAIDTARARTLRVTYRVYANELTVRTNELNDRHAFWNNSALLMHPQGELDEPSLVTVRPFGNWKISTGLPFVSSAAANALNNSMNVSASGAANNVNVQTADLTNAASSTALNPLQPGTPQTFRAPNYDILYDSPFLVSDFKSFEFQSLGKPHRFVIDGEGNADLAKLQRDVPKIVEASARLFDNTLPYDNYTFMLMLAQGGGGLEHLNSTALIARRFAFSNDNSYRGFLSLVAHEFYHLWNVKRIRPDALGPFDYSNENYTRLLWVAEGLTSYYENIILRRAGLMTDRQFLDDLGNSLRQLQNTPGRFELSLEEASFDAWIKYYRQDENSINNQISYYDKGAIVGAMLDLEIRRRTNGSKSLDDVMLTLWREFALKNRNYMPEDFRRIASEVAGTSLETFFNNYVSGTTEIPYQDFLQPFGLNLNTRAEGNTAKPYFGANLAQTGDNLTVRNVLAESPAYNFGLNANDIILAMDNFRVNLAAFNERLNERKPGEEIALTVFRGDELRTLKIRLGQDTNGTFRITPVAAPSDDQRRLYQSWLNAELRTDARSDDDEEDEEE